MLYLLKYCCTKVTDLIKWYGEVLKAKTALDQLYLMYYPRFKEHT